MEDIRHILAVIDSLEETNQRCIYICLRENGNLPPVVYGRSARLLQEYFPNYPLKSMSAENGTTVDFITDFPLEEVLEFFMEEVTRVGNDYIKIVVG